VNFSEKAWQLARPFWVSDQRVAAWLLLTLIAVIHLLLVAIAVLLTYWQRAFFNSLENKAWSEFLQLLFSWHYSVDEGFMPGFGLILVFFVLLTVYALYLKQLLHIRWRSWSTQDLQARWLANQAYYRMTQDAATMDNPDQRIAEDIDLFVDKSLTLGFGLLTAIVSLISFVILLWSLSKDINPLGLPIPGNLVWIALVYAAIGTVVTHWLGRRLIGLNFSKQKAEANFRFALVRLRENAESVAFFKGEPSEEQHLNTLFGTVVTNWRHIMIVTKRVTFFTASYTQAALVFPLAMAAPAYFAGRVPLGSVFQTANAFVQVQVALSWIVDNYAEIAELGATVNRLHGFQSAVDAYQRPLDAINIHCAPSKQLTVSNLCLSLPNGQTILEPSDFSITLGERVLIAGASGSGKSTLMRALAGLWPHGSGEARIPKGRKMFIPQRPYVPDGTLRRALCYPLPEHQYSESQLNDALCALGLDALQFELDKHQNWSTSLSLGEVQRLAIVRALLFKPQWLFLDEATASLDAKAQSLMYEQLLERLPDASLFSIAHRQELGIYHQRVLTLENKMLINR